MAVGPADSPQLAFRHGRARPPARWAAWTGRHPAPTSHDRTLVAESRGRCAHRPDHGAPRPRLVDARGRRLRIAPEGRCGRDEGPGPGVSRRPAGHETAGDRGTGLGVRDPVGCRCRSCLGSRRADVGQRSAWFNGPLGGVLPGTRRDQPAGPRRAPPVVPAGSRNVERCPRGDPGHRDRQRRSWPAAGSRPVVRPPVDLGDPRVVHSPRGRRPNLVPGHHRPARRRCLATAPRSPG